jgi:hypothetical protein
MLPLQQGLMMLIMKVIDYVGDKCVSHSLVGIWTLVELSAFLLTCDSKHCQSSCSYSLQQSQAYPWANILSTYTSHGTCLHLCGLNGWSNVGIFCAWIIVCLSFFMAPSSSGTCLKSKILLACTVSYYSKILHKLLLKPMEYFVRKNTAKYVTTKHFTTVVDNLALQERNSDDTLVSRQISLWTKESWKVQS